MKNISLVLLAVALLAPGAWAAPAPGQKTAPSHNPAAAPGQNTAPSHNPAAGPKQYPPKTDEARIQELKAPLNLTADQAARFLDVSKEKSAAMKPILGGVAADVKQLTDMLKNHASDGELQSKLDEIDALNKTRRAAYEKWVTKVAEILSPTQQAQMLLYEKANSPPTQ